MDLKWGVRGKEKENTLPNREPKISNGELPISRTDPLTARPREPEPMLSAMEEYRVFLKKQIQNEIQSLIDDEIRAAGQELVREQWKAIRQTAEEHKQVIREVVEEERLAVHRRIEELRRTISTLGSGQASENSD